MNVSRGIDAEIRENSCKSGKKYFFGIGIDNYRHWRSLNNAVRDIKDVIAVLTNRYDFQTENVVLLTDEKATRENIVRTLHNYSESNSLTEDDSLLTYFSGHGFLDNNNDGYWVTHESSRDNIDSFIPNDTIRRLIRNIKCRHVLLISDSCFSGSLISSSRDIDGNLRTAEELERLKSRWIITSGGKDETVSDGANRNSPFAEAILSELRSNKRAKLIADEFGMRVRSITRGNARQMPQIDRFYEAGDLGGRFVFNLKVPVSTNASENAPANKQVQLAGNTTQEPQKEDISFVVERMATDILSRFMKILRSGSFEKVAADLSPYIHRSQKNAESLKPEFKANNLRPAYDRAKLYEEPVSIRSSKPTTRTSIGILAEREIGSEWMFSISKREENGELPGYFRIFFPENGAIPHITSINI